MKQFLTHARQFQIVAEAAAQPRFIPLVLSESFTLFAGKIQTRVHSQGGTIQMSVRGFHQIQTSDGIRDQVCKFDFCVQRSTPNLILTLRFQITSHPIRGGKNKIDLKPRPLHCSRDRNHLGKAIGDMIQQQITRCGQVRENVPEKTGDRHAGPIE